MGLIQHDAIVVTGVLKDIWPAWEKAGELELAPTQITPPVVNGYQSFLIPPDGSKEGWAESAVWEERRCAWIEWALSAQDLYFDWVYIRFGEALAPTGAYIRMSSRFYPQELVAPKNVEDSREALSEQETENQSTTWETCQFCRATSRALQPDDFPHICLKPEDRVRALEAALMGVRADLWQLKHQLASESAQVKTLKRALVEVRDVSAEITKGASRVLRETRRVVKE